jgi:hypothetical protein
MFNTRKIIQSSAVSCAIAFILGTPIVSAIEITSTLDSDNLANALIIPSSGITITSSSLFGGESGDYGGALDPVGQAGIFTNNSGVYGLPSSGGVVFSTGNVSDYEDGPNNNNSNSGGIGNFASDGQNDTLTGITGQTEHFDPVQLDITFDVDANVNVISFIAAFGSEEFPDFVGSGFVDGFGMFLNGVNVAGALPTGGVAGDLLLPININHPDFAPITGTELNGMIAPNGIPLMRFDIPVTPGSTGNTFSLLLADAGDAGYDSTIFLSSFGNFETDSGNSEFTPILPDPSNPTNEDGAFVFTLPEVQANETIWIDPDVAVGYTYTATGGGLFASVTAPSKLTVNDDDGYEVIYFDGFNTITETLLAGQTLSFSVAVSEFTIIGIDKDLGLDPTNPLAFATGVSFSQGGTGFGVLQLPILPPPDDVVGVPAPTSITLFGLSLIGMGLIRRKLKTK